MSDLAEQILAAIAAEESLVHSKSEWSEDRQGDLTRHTLMCGWRLGEAIADECSCDVPAVILRRCAADREIVASYRRLCIRYQELKASDGVDEVQLRPGETVLAEYFAVTLPALARAYGLEET